MGTISQILDAYAMQPASISARARHPVDHVDLSHGIVAHKHCICYQLSTATLMPYSSPDRVSRRTCLIIGCIYKVVKKNLVVGYERDEITYRRGTWHPCSWPWAIGQRSDAVLRPIAKHGTTVSQGQLHDRRYVRKASTTQDREGAASLCYTAMVPCPCCNSTFLAPHKGGRFPSTFIHYCA
jgi:hypothetical protein